MAELSPDWECGDSDVKTKFNMDDEDGEIVTLTKLAKDDNVHTVNLFNAAVQSALGSGTFLVFPGYGH